jgi:hypothetical protein
MSIYFSLRAVNPDGSLGMFLPDFASIDISPVFSSVGAISIKYPQSGTNFGILGDDLEIAVMVNGSEVTSLRSIIEQMEGNDADDQADSAVWTFTCRTMLGMLDRAVVYPALWPTSSEPARQDYQASTPGKILGDLITKAHNRGSLSWLNYDFSDTLDSAGQPWANSIDIGWDANTKYTDVVQNLVDNLFVEVAMDARTLRAFNPGGLGSDKTTGPNPLRFIRGRDMKESPRKVSTRELGTVVLVAGKNNNYVERVDSTAVSVWGRREIGHSANNVETTGILSIIGDALLSGTTVPRLEVTHGLHFETEVNPKPTIDFDLGDWALSDVGRGLERYRIRQWVVSIDNDGSVTGSVTLNQLIDEQIAKLNKRIDALNNGTTETGASQPEDDGKTPLVPTGVNVSSGYYITDGRARSAIQVSWSAVTSNTDGSALSNFEGYTARWRYFSDSADAWRGVKLVDAGVTFASFDDINPGAVIVAQVEAHNRYGRSAGYSALVSHTTAGDTTPPVKTSAPVVTSNVGTLRVTWDGLSSTAGAMDSDLAGVEVHVGPNGTFTPTTATLRDYLPGANKTATTLTTGLSYNTEYWVRLVPVDTSGNKGPASDETTTSHVVLSPVVNVEIGSGEVGLSNVRFSDVGNLVDDGNLENASVRSNRAMTMTGTHFSFDNTTASIGSWSIKASSYAGGSTEYLGLQTGLPIKPGERVFGAADYRCTSDTAVLSRVELGIQFKNSAGFVIDGSGSPNPSAFFALTGNYGALYDNQWHARVSGLSQVAPTNAVTMDIVLSSNSLTAGSVWIDAIEVRRQVDTLLIADAAITNAKIANLAVNDAKIASLSVGKLTTGTLGADIVVGARIKTADTGARVELNSTGVSAYNSGGTRTFYADASTGNISIIGEFASGNTGQRVVINPGNSGSAVIQLWNSTGTDKSSIQAWGTASDANLEIRSGTDGATSVPRYSSIVAAKDSIALSRYTTLGGGVPSGGRLYMDDNTGFFGTTNVAGDHGAFQFSNSWAQMNGGASWYWMQQTNGQVFMRGSFSNYTIMGSTDGIQAGSIALSNNGGMSLTYGATMSTTMCPMGTLYDTTGVFKRWQVTASSSTGYTVSFDANATGAWFMWTIRVS